MSAIWDREEDKPSDPGPQKGPSSMAKIEAERKAVINWLAAEAKGVDSMTYALKKTIEHLQSKKKD